MVVEVVVVVDVVVVVVVVATQGPDKSQVSTPSKQPPHFWQFNRLSEQLDTVSPTIRGGITHSP